MAIKPLLASRLPQAWRNKGPLACALLPVAALYQLVFGLRRVLFQSGLLPVQRLDARVLVVGNVIAGGAGKTPTVIAIAQYLSGRGLTVGLVSRGYGRLDAEIREVHADSSPREVGDEPLLIHNATGCPVFVGTDRYQAAQALLRQHPGVNYVLCDDGLQHFALYRDMEVCVFDDRGRGNGWVLPAGPLREPWPRSYVGRSGQSASQTLVLHTGKRPAFAGYAAKRSLTRHAVRKDGSRVALDTVATANTKPLYAVAGLAQPKAFFDMLTALPLTLAGTVALPDHCDYQDFDPSLNAKYQLLCTEKDAAKLWQVAPDALAVPLVQTMGDDFWQALNDCLGLGADAQLSSPHGYKTT